MHITCIYCGTNCIFLHISVYSCIYIAAAAAGAGGSSSGWVAVDADGGEREAAGARGGGIEGPLREVDDSPSPLVTLYPQLGSSGFSSWAFAVLVF